MPFFLLFTVFPLVEVIVFMKISAHIGLGTALLLSLLTAIIGGVIVRRQGLKTMNDIKDALMEGYIPSNEIFDAICLVAAGGFLITPGFVSDIIGILLLVPKIRDLLRDYALRFTFFQVMEMQSHPDENYPSSPPSSILEGEYERVDEHDKNGKS